MDNKLATSNTLHRFYYTCLRYGLRDAASASSCALLQSCETYLIHNKVSKLEKYLIQTLVQTSINGLTYVDDYSQIITYKQCLDFLRFSKNDTILNNLKIANHNKYQEIIYNVGSELLFKTVDLGLKILTFTGFSIKKFIVMTKNYKNN